ncbi:MAG: hypothetical protein HKN76_11950 [Saprospiraceae bacterium]|nr:hypothetical protein [Saprospiraceae bacterium]
MNKKDKLEEFISMHREAFDDERPSFKVWADIEARIQNKKNPKSIIWPLAIAASLLLLLGIALGVLIYPKLNEYQEMQAYAQVKDLNGAEHYFDSQVDALLVELKGDEMQINSLNEELSRIDRQVADLKDQLADAPVKSKEKIYEAIIASFEAKIELLETAVNREKEFKIIKDEIQHI